MLFYIFLVIEMYCFSVIIITNLFFRLTATVHFLIKEMLLYRVCVNDKYDITVNLRMLCVF